MIRQAITPARLAVLIDGENIAPGFLGQIRALWPEIGAPVVQRVYGNAATLGWGPESGFRIIHTGTGKNATDIALCLDAATLAIEERVHTIAIVASDGDYRHLAHWLRERGLRVVAICEPKAPAGFREACHEVHLLSPMREKPNLTNVEERVVKLLAGMPEGIGVHEIGRLAGLTKADINTKSWRLWLEARLQFFVLEPKAPGAKVRLRKHLSAACGVDAPVFEIP